MLAGPCREVRVGGEHRLHVPGDVDLRHHRHAALARMGDDLPQVVARVEPAVRAPIAAPGTPGADGRGRPPRPDLGEPRVAARLEPPALVVVQVQLDHVEPVRRRQVDEAAPAGQHRQPEEAEPFGKVDLEGSRAQVSQQLGQNLGRARPADPLADLAPHVGLPAVVRRERAADRVEVLAGRPPPDQVGSMEVVAVEQVGDPPGLRVAEAIPPESQDERIDVVGIVGVVAVDQDGEHGPHHPLDRPRVRFVLGSPGGQHPGAERARKRRGQVRGHAVVATRATRTEVAGQLEPQPCPHPGARGGDPLGCHRIRRGGAQHLGQPCGEGLGAVGDGHVEHVEEGTRTL